MTLIVQKYGGTSMGSVERIEHVAGKVAQTRAQGHDVVVVVSAMSGETDRLIKLAKSVNPRGSAREFDQIASTGEQVTIGLLALALEKRGLKARSYTGAQVAIRTDSAYSKARIQNIDAKKLRADCAAGIVPVVAGFQGIDDTGSTTTLGRGGSDTTGVALAAALKADECQIYTDVDGVYTTIRASSPKRRLDRDPFEEMLELASLGNRNTSTGIRSVEFAGKYKVPLRVLSRSWMDPALITLDDESKREVPWKIRWISGIAFNRATRRRSPSSSALPQLLASPRPSRPVGDANIEVDMIVQNVAADASTDFTFTVHRNDFDRAHG
jgi:aspartate kinase